MKYQSSTTKDKKLDDLLLQRDIIFLKKELDNKQRTIGMLLQQISENIRPTHQVENTTFNHDNVRR